MAWTTPETRSAGDVLSAAGYNTQIRDNLLYLHSGQPATALARSSGSSYTTASGDWEAVDATNLTIHLTTSTGRVLIAVTGSFYADAPSRLLSLDIEIDGVRIGPLAKEALDSTARIISFTLLRTGLSAGSHTFRLMWKVEAGGIGYLFSESGAPVHFVVAEW